MPVDYINEDGSFDQEKLSGQLGTIAGEGFKDSKALANTPNVDVLVKNFLNADRKVNQKLEGVIQKPAENATDQEKAEYRVSLLKELGAPDTEDAYDFPRVEGMDYDENAEKVFRSLFKEMDMPVDLANALVAKFNEVQVGRQEAFQKVQDDAFEKGTKELDADWKGDDATKKNRTVFKAIMEFGTEDLKTLLKESKIYDSPNDHQKWRELGFDAAQRRVWENIGTKMKSDEHITDEGGPAKGEQLTGGQKALAGLYTHPDSKEMVSKSKL